MRISDWNSDVGTSDLPYCAAARSSPQAITRRWRRIPKSSKPIWGPAMHDAATATASATGAAELAVSGLNAWYGESHVLHGMEFEVRRGEVVTLLGRNGAGKTTTMKAVMGVIQDRKGSIRFGGTELHGKTGSASCREGG